jgi:hypothetical protein
VESGEIDPEAARLAAELRCISIESLPALVNAFQN